MQTLHVLGIDHTVATVQVREELAFSKTEISGLLPALLGGRDRFSEAMILCTCNRTEVYLVNPGPLTAYPLDAFQRLRPSEIVLDKRLDRYVHSGAPAVEHLFAVASSLRSQMPGDTQISRQLAAAVQLARSAGASGPFLNRAVDSALRCAKRVRSSTGLSAGGDSLGAEVLRILKRRFPRPASVVVSGTGALASEIVCALSRASSSGAAQRFSLAGVWSSNFERAQSFAAGFSTLPLTGDAFAASLALCDALILAGAGPHPLLHPRALVGRRSPLFILDLGVPRNLNPAEFPSSNAVVLDLDGIQQSAAASRARRHEAIENAKAIVREEAGRFIGRAGSRAQYPFRAQTYQTIESLIDRLRPSAPAHAARLRIGFHRALAEFYQDRRQTPARA